MRCQVARQNDNREGDNTFFNCLFEITNHVVKAPTSAPLKSKSHKSQTKDSSSSRHHTSQMEGKEVCPLPTIPSACKQCAIAQAYTRPPPFAVTGPLTDL